MKLKLLFQETWTIYAVVEERNGTPVCPLEDFLCGVPADHARSVDAMLALLSYVAENGPRDLSDKLSHYIDKDERIWEFIKGGIRVAWFYDEGRIVVCSHAFLKNSQKTPKSERARAVDAKEQYLAAKAAGKLKLID
jgi:phage-related protein